jgi:hypothetical protein
MWANGDENDAASVARNQLDALTGFLLSAKKFACREGSRLRANAHKQRKAGSHDFIAR